MLMNPKKISKQRKKLKKLWIKQQLKQIELGTTKNSLQAFLANAQRGNTFLMRKRLIAWYQKMTGERYIMINNYRKKKQQEAKEAEKLQRVADVEEALVELTKLYAEQDDALVELANLIAEEE